MERNNFWRKLVSISFIDWRIRFCSTLGQVNQLQLGLETRVLLMRQAAKNPIHSVT